MCGGAVGGTGVAQNFVQAGIAFENGVAAVVVLCDEDEFFFEALGCEVLLDELDDDRRVGNEVGKGDVFDSASDENTCYCGRDGVGTVADHLRHVE